MGFEENFDKALAAAGGAKDEKRFEGTCQACLNQQITKPKGRSKDPLLVLHGYKRPGTGETIGRCAGAGHLPFELSCEFTKEWKDDLEHMLARERKFLAELNANRVTMLFIEIRDRSRPYTYGRKPPTKNIEIHPGWKNESASDYPATWEQAVEARKRQTKTEIESLESDIKVLGQRIADWVYAPDKLGRPPGPQISAAAEGRSWYHSEGTQRLLRSLPAPVIPGRPARPGTTLLAWLEHQRPMMMFTTIRGATKPGFFDYARRELARAQGLPLPAPTPRRGSKPAAPPPPPKPVSKKQAALLADLVAKGGEHVYQDSDMSTYYTACDLKERKMATWDFMSEPTYGETRQPRLVKVTITAQGREALGRYQAGDTMGARMAARKAGAA